MVLLSNNQIRITLKRIWNHFLNDLQSIWGSLVMDNKVCWDFSNNLTMNITSFLNPLRDLKRLLANHIRASQWPGLISKHCRKQHCRIDIKWMEKRALRPIYRNIHGQLKSVWKGEHSGQYTIQFAHADVEWKLHITIRHIDKAETRCRVWNREIAAACVRYQQGN